MAPSEPFTRSASEAVREANTNKNRGANQFSSNLTASAKSKATQGNSQISKSRSKASGRARAKATAKTRAIAESKAGKGVFTLFPQLPFELREQIWAFVLPARRVIRIDHRKGYKDQVFYTGPAVHRQASSCRHLITTSEPPSLLYTCRQSRALCLKHYQLSFGGILFYPFYFNPVQDIILLANKQVLDDLCAHHNARMLEQYGVRFLALDPILTWRNDSAYDTVHFHVNGQWQAAKSLVDGVKKFATLSQLTVLYPNHSYDCNTHHCHWSLPVGVFFGKRLKKILRRKHLEDRTRHSERPLRQPQTQISNQTMGSVTWAMPKMFLTEYKTTADGRNDMEEQLLAHMDDGIDHKVKNEDVD